jgi:hypothetical protein
MRSYSPTKKQQRVTPLTASESESLTEHGSTLTPEMLKPGFGRAVLNGWGTDEGWMRAGAGAFKRQTGQ